MSTIIYNGQEIPAQQPCIKYNDRGFALGHGLFETILIKNSHVPLLDYHWKRLSSSASLLNVVIPFSQAQFYSMLLTLIKNNGLEHSTAGARLTITQGEAERGLIAPVKNSNYVISVFAHRISSNLNYTAEIVSTRKNESSLSSKVKSINYLDNIFAKQEAIDLGFNEAILLNSRSNIADGAISNIFIVANDKIYTPLISDGALPGVIRGVLLEEFFDIFSIEEKTITVAELFNAQEVFITNALLGVQPVQRISNKNFSQHIISSELALMFKNKKNYI